jgi:hypothetical protein
MSGASALDRERTSEAGKWSLVLSVVGVVSLVALLMLPPLWPAAQASTQDNIDLLEAPLTTLYILLALAVPALGFAALILGALGTIQQRRKRWVAVVGGVLGVLVMLAAYSYYWKPIISVMPI